MNVKKILVIDDSPWNVASAHLTLKGYDYKMVSNIKEAYEVLTSGEVFDVVLTDLWLPRGEFTGEMRGGDTETTMIAAGLVFAIRATNLGMKVVICTDSDHHEDRLVSVMDMLRNGRYEKRTTNFVDFVEARQCPVRGVWENGKIVLTEDWYDSKAPNPKDWLKVMQAAGIVPYD